MRNPATNTPEPSLVVFLAKTACKEAVAVTLALFAFAFIGVPSEVFPVGPLEREILNPVVIFDSVDVVHHFVAFEQPSKVRLHHEPVLEHYALAWPCQGMIAFHDCHVSGTGFPATSSVLGIKFGVEFLAAFGATPAPFYLLGSTCNLSAAVNAVFHSANNHEGLERGYKEKP